MLLRLKLFGIYNADLWEISIELRFNFFLGQIFLKADKTLGSFHFPLLLRLICLLTLPNGGDMIGDDCLTSSNVKVDTSLGLFLMREVDIGGRVRSRMQIMVVCRDIDGLYLFGQYLLGLRI